LTQGEKVEADPLASLKEEEHPLIELKVLEFVKTYGAVAFAGMEFCSAQVTEEGSCGGNCIGGMVEPPNECGDVCMCDCGACQEFVDDGCPGCEFVCW
jgi:hypothetical protein